MRINWKKRLGVCGGLTLLCLTVIAGALASSAGAQVVTGELDVVVRVDQGSAGSAQRSEFQYQVDGGPATNWPASGVFPEMLDVSVPHTITPVDHAGYTVAVDTSIGDCTDVTLVVGTPGFCRFIYTFIEPPTTTTTTTTTVPETTIPPPPGQVTVHGSAVLANKCNLTLSPPLQPASVQAVTVTLSTDASPQPHLGDPITLSHTNVTISVAKDLIQTGVNVGLLHDGDTAPSVITVVVAGSNTTQQTHTYVIHLTAVIRVIGGQAQPLKATVGVPNTNWTPVNGTSDVAFTEKSMRIVSTLNLNGQPVIATFVCDPPNTSFVALGATGAPTTTSGGGGGSTTPTSAGGGPGDTTGVGPAAELPRTGSTPWPLIVLAAICIDLGMLALAGAKRGRRLLRR